ncbi:MAG: glycine cleavage system aminomethyltransferase GcvT [Calditrichaeota bacterium]|nr:glycine cleavage system aminomethyltransferase GcvT [Calditrichota bacterium]MCB9367952.1 glycine cleavage system aminomethyltransferase GcvT [Calditrichota bacterium]
MKTTALTAEHAALGAKLVDFAGYKMPIQYRSIRAEHLRVRSTVGVFDVSHMGEFIVRGKDREEFLHYVTVNDVKSMVVGQAQYSCMCRPDGGIVDDLLIYKGDDHFMVVVNASNMQKDWDWLSQNLRGDVTMEDKSEQTSLLAVQGRNAVDVIQKLTKTDLSAIKFYHFAVGSVAGRDVVIARTGYTGEDGFELYLKNEDAVHVWQEVLDKGKEFDIEPVGLGARDSLRLEMKMCLYGNDIDDTTHPLEAGLGWITKLDKGDFIGRDVLLKAKEKGLTRKLVAIELEGSAFPRHGYVIQDASGKEIGKVTSGTVSPSLNKGIALGYVPSELSAIGSEVFVVCHSKPVKSKVVKPPFYKRPY